MWGFSYVVVAKLAKEPQLKDHDKDIHDKDENGNNKNTNFNITFCICSIIYKLWEVE